MCNRRNNDARTKRKYGDLVVIRYAKITEVLDSKCYVTFLGESEQSAMTYHKLSSYTPVVGDMVAIIEDNKGKKIILGKSGKGYEDDVGNGDCAQISHTHTIDNIVGLGEELDTIKQCVSSGKELIARAITDKGISSSSSDTFVQMHDKIKSIITSSDDLPIKVTYAFENTKIGNAYGYISINLISDAYRGLFKCFWGDENNLILEEFKSPFCEVDLTNSNHAYRETNKCLCIPVNAKTIIIQKDGANLVNLTLPQAKLINKQKKYSFGLLSDVHIDPEPSDTSNSVNDFKNALSYFKNMQNVDMVIINGDMITHGTMNEMTTFRSLVDGQDLPVYCCRGNHDTYGECTLINYTEYIDKNGLYYEKVFNDDIYLFLGMYIEDMANPYAQYSIDWLKQKLEEYKDKRVFLFQHVFIGPVGNVDGLYAINDGLVNGVGNSARDFIDLMQKYRNVVFFSGHSHFEFRMQQLSSNANCSERTDNMCHRVHTPSGCKVRTCDFENPSDIFYKDDSGEGYTVDVYDDFIVLRGFNVVNNESIADSQYIIHTDIVEIDKPVIKQDYEYKKNFTTFEQGSLTSDGNERDSSSSMRSLWIELNKNPNKSFRFGSGITYIRICAYDVNKNFIQLVNHEYEEGKVTKDGTIIEIPNIENLYYIRIKMNGDTELVEFNGEQSNEIVETYLAYFPPTVNVPLNKPFPQYDIPEEPEDKYEKAKWKCINFLKGQLNASNFYSPLSVQVTEIDLGVKFAHGVIDSIYDSSVIQNKYITLDQDYNNEYEGIISGKWYRSLKNPEKYRVDVYLKSDVNYFVDSCDLKPDNTWSTSRQARKGFKHIQLVERESGKQIEYGYPIVDNYYVKIYNLDDVEYEKETCRIFVKDGKYQFFSLMPYSDKKYMAKVYDLNQRIVGMSSEYSNIKYGQFPSSYLVPMDDPNYDKEGNSALGKHGYLLNSRSFLYDIALCLLVFTVNGDYDICRKILNRLQHEQKENGSFNFSYDNYIGQLFEDYIRTGVMGWVVWGMCYYAIKTKDYTYNDMIKKAGEWLLSQQVTDSLDNRYGLLKGGFGEYSADYIYSPTQIEWCSTEHNCSALQAIRGLYSLTGDQKYKDCIDLTVQGLINSLYDEVNGRFYQGCSPDSVDDAWAIDCLTWAGKTMKTAGKDDIATKCKDSTLNFFKADNLTIIRSEEKENYNTTYWLKDGITVNGFKPYGEGYHNPPHMIWTEGTLGAIALFKSLGLNDEANNYIDEMIKLQNCENCTGGLIYSNKTFASIPWEFHVWESVVSSAWLYLVLTDVSIIF